MKRMMIALAGAALLLAGCSSGGDDDADKTSVTTVTESAPAAIATTTRDLQSTLNGLEALYLSQVQPVTPSLTDNERIDYGYATCQRLDEGETLNDSVIALQVNHRVPRQEAAFVAMWTPQYLCTEHKERVTAEMKELAGG